MTAGLHFKDGALLFCGGGLALSCCGGFIDPNEIPGWDVYGYMPDEWVHFPKNTPAMIGALCPVNDCALQSNSSGGKFSGIGTVLAYPVGLTEDEMRVFVDEGIYYIVPLKGPFTDISTAIGIITTHREALINYARYCVCTSAYKTDCDPAGLQNQWFTQDDYGGYWDQMTCGLGAGLGPGPGDDAWSCVAEWETKTNKQGVSFNFMLKRNGGSWQTFGSSGSLELVLFPCDEVRMGGDAPPEDPYALPWGAGDYGGYTVEISAYGPPAEECTPEISAAFAAVPDGDF